MKYSGVFIIVFWLSQLAFAQTGTLSTNLSYKDGFREGTVYAIIKDQKGFMWYATSDGLWKFDGYRHTQYLHDPKNENSLSDNFVVSLKEDSKGIMWAGTLNGGLNRFDPAANTFRHYRHDKSDSTSLPDNYVPSVTEDKQGNIWVASGKLNLLNKEQNGFEHFDDPKINQWGASEVFTDRSGVLWIGSVADGFCHFDLKSKSFKHFRVDHPDPTIRERSNVVRAFSEDDQGNLWIATYGGLVKFHKESEEITHWVHHEGDSSSLSHNSIWDLSATQDGKVWISTWGGGISCFDTGTGLFENNNFREGGIYGVNAQEFPCIYRESTGTFWIGSNARGIFRIKPLPVSPLKKSQGLLRKTFRLIEKGKRLTYFISFENELLAWSAEKGIEFTLYPKKENKQTSLSGNRIASVSETKTGTIHVGTDFGLTSYDPSTKKINHYVNNPQDTGSLSHNAVITTFVDSKDNLWIGTPYGLNLFDPKTGKFARWRKPLLSSNTVVSLTESSEGLWVGTSTGGLNSLNTRQRTGKAFLHDDKNDSSLSGTYVRAIVVDSARNLWVGVSETLNKFNPSTGSFEHFRLGETILVLSENKKHNLLVQTTDALYEMSNRRSSKESVFTKKELLTTGVKAIWSPKENQFYLFFEKSIGILPVDSIKENHVAPPIGITAFSLDPNNKHPLDSAEARLNPAYRKEITLDYNQNLFSIEFAALDFINPVRNEYAYKLDGFDEDWTYSGTRRFVTYTNLSPGNYTFRAKGSNNEGYWNDEGTSLKITILPPPWKTWWAYTGYSLAFLGLLFMGRQVIVNRERLKAQVTLEQKEKQTLKELDNLKTKFFSNITHEFRTPLTLIQGPANELLEKTNDPGARQLLHMVKNNAGRLLTLINQLLDLARLDASEMKLNLHPVRLDSLLKITISQFTSMASAKNIQLEWVIPEKEITVLADEEKLDTILINLISNAIKFTPSGGHVAVIAGMQNNLFEIEVKDNGRGIPPEKIPHIFDRFYQVEATDSSHAEGTGIGLALVKEYVELMKGIIRVDSQAGTGTSMKVSLTLETVASQIAEPIRKLIQEDLILPEEISNANIELPTLLIVEDNADIRLFVKTCLGSHYRYSEAANGREGLEKARNEIPDLIISDLMMPEMDGLELCAMIKKDERTNHIPFIMLTAKAAEENKLEGLQTGADDYLVKPFNKAELALKVQNLVLLREKLQAHIKKHLLAQATPVEATSAAEQFIVKARTFIEAHLSDETLNVETLAGEMNLGREQCYRKIIALTGLSPSAFIRKLRLQKAAHLLGTKWGAVSQVAYEVGFGNLSYFSKAFKEEFGKLPSEY